MKDLSFININNQRNESSYTSSLAVNQNYIKEEKSLNVSIELEDDSREKIEEREKRGKKNKPKRNKSKVN